MGLITQPHATDSRRFPDISSAAKRAKRVPAFLVATNGKSRKCVKLGDVTCDKPTPLLGDNGAKTLFSIEEHTGEPALGHFGVAIAFDVFLAGPDLFNGLPGKPGAIFSGR